MSTTELPRAGASAADIVIPPELTRQACSAAPASLSDSAAKVLPGRPAHAEPRSSQGDAELFRRLRRLKDSSGSNKNDQVIVLIEGCISEGLNQGKRITGAVASLGFNKRHVGKLLREKTGKDPKRHRWTVDEAGFYTLTGAD